MWGTGRKYFDCIDLHCGGEPARIMFSTNCPPIPGKSMAEKREHFIKSFDHIRRILLEEPRGYPCQNLNIIFPSEIPDIQWGYIILEQKAVYPLFSGHNTICVVTALLETGHIQMIEPLTNFKLEAPGGPIEISARCKNGRVLDVNMTAVPSFVAASNVQVVVPTLKHPVTMDIAFGGMFYAIVQTDDVDGLPTLLPENGKDIATLGANILKAARQQHPVSHPIVSQYVGPDIIVFHDSIKTASDSDETPSKMMKATTDDVHKATHSTRNTVVMQLSSKCDKETGLDIASGMLDRSPCGSGTAALVASKWNKGDFKIGDVFINESIVGSKFEATVRESGPLVGPYKSVIVDVKGRAFISGFNRLVVDPDDPFPEGFTVGDIWA